MAHYANATAKRRAYRHRKADRRRAIQEHNYEERLEAQKQEEAEQARRTKDCPDSCKRKRGHPDEATALHVLAQMMLSKPMSNPPIPYYCEKCRYWRLGRVKPKE